MRPIYKNTEQKEKQKKNTPFVVFAKQVSMVSCCNFNAD